MSTKQFAFKIILIADRISSFGNITMETENLEFVEDEYFFQVYEALEKMSRGVVHYNSPQEFINNIHRHSKDLIFPVWSGTRSRNRKALIPSICEAYKVKFIGADTYANIICQDKALSKEFAKRQGIQSSSYVIYNYYFNPESLYELSLPLVVKPNFEGGSIGISKFNLCKDYSAALKLAKEIFNTFKQDILIEEFMPGREVSIVISGNGATIKLVEAVELVLENHQGGFLDKLYSYEIKKNDEDTVTNKLLKGDIAQETLDRCVKVFKLLGKVENLRIDGRLWDGEFKLMELSPDIHYGKGSTFSHAFEATGFSYEEMMQILVKNAVC